MTDPTEAAPSEPGGTNATPPAAPPPPTVPPPAAATPPDPSDPAGHSGEKFSMKGAGIVSAMTLLSRMLGFVRDVQFVYFFGSTPVADAFILAFTIPNLLRRLFGEGALSSAFIPVFVESMEKARMATPDEKDAARKRAVRLANVILTRLAVLLSVVTAIVSIGCAVVALWGLSSPDSAQGAPHLTLWLLAMMMPYNIFINSAAIIAGILNAHRRFTVAAFAPVMLNVINISTLFFMPQLLHGFGVGPTDPHDPLHAAPAAYIYAISVLIAGVAQVGVMIPSLLACGFIPRPVWQPDDAGYYRVIKNFIPLVLGLAVFQINTLADRLMAEVLVPGSGAVTSLYIGNQLMQFPLALIATAFGTAALPTLSSLYARGETEGFKNNLLLAFRQTFFLTVPAAVGLYVLAVPLTDLCFGSGEFARHNPTLLGNYFSGAPHDPVERAALVMQCYAPGLVFFAINILLSRAFYAMQDTKTPLKISLIAMAANIIGNYTFLLIWGDQLGEASLALSSSISGVIQTVLLVIFLFRKLGGTSLAQVRGWLIRSGFAIFVGYIAASIVSQRLLGDGSQAPDPANMASNFLTGFVKDFIFMLFIGTLLFTIYQTWYSHYRVRDGKLVHSAAPLISFKMLTSLFKDETAPEDRDKIEFHLPRDVIAMTSITWTILSSTAMGLFIWHLLHSLPAADRGIFSVRLERGLVPVIGGMVCFWMVTSALNMEEYHNVLSIFMRRKLPSGAAPAKG